MIAHLLRLGLIELPKLSNILRDLLSATEQDIGPTLASALKPRNGYEIRVQLEALVEEAQEPVVMEQA